VVAGFRAERRVWDRFGYLYMTGSACPDTHVQLGLGIIGLDRAGIPLHKRGI